MNTNDIILLVVLTMGAAWMNWGTIQGDFFKRTRNASTPPLDNHRTVVHTVRKKQKESA